MSNPITLIQDVASQSVFPIWKLQHVLKLFQRNDEVYPQSFDHVATFIYYTFPTHKCCRVTSLSWVCSSEILWSKHDFWILMAGEPVISSQHVCTRGAFFLRSRISHRTRGELLSPQSRWAVFVAGRRLTAGLQDRRCSSTRRTVPRRGDRDELQGGSKCGAIQVNIAWKGINCGNWTS